MLTGILDTIITFLRLPYNDFPFKITRGAGYVTQMVEERPCMGEAMGEGSNSTGNGFYNSKNLIR